MCQERLSQDPSQEELPAQSHRLHEDGLWGCGQHHGCLSHLPQHTRPERVHLPTPLGKKCIQQTSIFPNSPFFWGFTPCRKHRWEAFCSAQRSWALPQPPVRCCWAWEPFNLPTPAFLVLGLSSTPQRRAKSQLIDSRVRSAPTHRAGTVWLLSPAILNPLWWILSASCAELVTCWWLATQPLAQAAHPIRQTVGAPAVSAWRWVGQSQHLNRVEHHTLTDWTCLTAARAGHLNDMWKPNTKL